MRFVNGVEIAKIVSGGQTGADRAALDVAIELGLPYSGWCPAGGWAEDLPDPPGVLAPYPRLRETPSDDPSVRTRLNVRDSDATLVVRAPGKYSPGSDLTIATAEKMGRPCLETMGDPDTVTDWLMSLPTRIGGIRLNVAGPRESYEPGVYDTTRYLLRAVLSGGH